MDTILASIRRILNEDEVAPAEAAPARSEAGSDAAKAAAPKEDVLVLKEAMMVPPEKIEPPPPAAPPPAAPPPAARPLAAPQPVDEQPSAAPPVIEGAVIEGLVAARTRAAAAQSFDALHEALRRDQAPMTTPASSPTLLRAGGPTIEDLVRDELRGLLSTWLDVHLPGLVETLVRSEIEKLTRR